MNIKKAQIRERAAVLAELEVAKKKNNVQTPLKQSLKRTETEEKQEPQYISLPFPALPGIRRSRPSIFTKIQLLI